MRRLAIFPIGLAVSLPLVMAGCGGDEGAAPTTAPQDQAVDTTLEPAPAPKYGSVDVTMKDIQFEPADVKDLKAGDKVVWTNDDSVPHTATAESGAEFDSGTLEPGDTFEWKTEEAGEVSYVCTIHPQMTGTITVE